MPRKPTPAGTTLTRGRMAGLGTALLVAGLALMVLGWSTGALLLAAKAVLFLTGLVLVTHGLSRVVWAARSKRPDILVWLCITWLVVLMAVAALAPMLPLPEHVNVASALSEPSYQTPRLLSDHPLGTNNYGLDMLSRSIYGARTSLVISLMAVAIGSIVGGAIGVVAGYYRSGIDSVIGIFTNALLAVPPLILLIALGTVLEPKIRNIAFALALLTIPSMIRLARANTIAFAQREFVLAARAMGATKLRVMARELVPNVVLPVFSMVIVMISVLIVAEASLSFLGLGIQAPEPTWGNMIAEAEGGTLEDYPHIVLVPGAFLFLTVFSFNLLGEKAQKRWDPRSAKL
jgi:peptide/nickel transport system permease protein